MVSSAELQLINDNSQPENDKDASGGDSPKVRCHSVGLQSDVFSISSLPSNTHQQTGFKDRICH